MWFGNRFNNNAWNISDITSEFFQTLHIFGNYTKLVVLRLNGYSFSRFIRFKTVLRLRLHNNLLAKFYNGNTLYTFAATDTSVLLQFVSRISCSHLVGALFHRHVNLIVFHWWINTTVAINIFAAYSADVSLPLLLKWMVTFRAKHGTKYYSWLKAASKRQSHLRYTWAHVKRNWHDWKRFVSSTEIRRRVTYIIKDVYHMRVISWHGNTKVVWIQTISTIKSLISALLQLHLHYQINTWLQWTEQRQLQDETRNINVWGLGASYIR